MSDNKNTNAKPPEFHGDEDAQRVLRWTWGARQEAYTAKRNRMNINRVNYDTYNMIGDFSGKTKGQSKEFLPKMNLAVEQIASFMHQAMVDVGDWFSIESEPGVDEKNLLLRPEEMQKILKRQFEKIKFGTVIEDSIKMGLIGSLMIAKVHGEYVDRSTVETKNEMDGDGKVRNNLFRKTKKVWRLKIDLVRQEDWFPDPTGDGLYDIQQVEMDLHQLKKMAEGDNAIYDKKVVDQIQGGFDDMDQQSRKARETGQNQSYETARKRVRVWECYGTVLDPTTGEVIMENATWTVANDRYLIRKPTKVAFWHGQSPFIVAPIVRVPKSVWHKALMDAAVALNLALNEMFNLMLDSGIMAAFGIKQWRPDWVVDPEKYQEGIPAGETIPVNDNCPPGMKALETVATGQSNPDAQNTYNMLNAEFSASAMTNDLRMGVMPQRAVKATEVVEASQSLTSTFSGISKIVENDYVVEVVKKSWLTVAQHVDDLDDSEVRALLGEARARELATKSNEEIFASTAQGYCFKVFGISLTLKKMQDYRKIITMLQTVMGSSQLSEEFMKKYSFTKLLSLIMRSLDIDVTKIENDEDEQVAMASQPTMQRNPQQGGSPGAPNMQSQIPQAMAAPAEGAGGPQPNAGAPAPHFPPSRATPRGGF